MPAAPSQVFGVTLDPFIVYSSNLFAILSLRGLYGFVATFMKVSVRTAGANALGSRVERQMLSVRRALDACTCGPRTAWDRTRVHTACDHVLQYCM